MVGSRVFHRALRSNCGTRLLAAQNVSWPSAENSRYRMRVGTSKRKRRSSGKPSPVCGRVCTLRGVITGVGTGVGAGVAAGVGCGVGAGVGVGVSSRGVASSIIWIRRLSARVQSASAFSRTNR